MLRIFPFLFLFAFCTQISTAHTVDLHKDFVPKLSGIRVVDFDLIPQSATDSNVNRVLGIFLFAVKKKDTSFLNYIDSAAMTQGNGIFIFLNKIYEFSDSARNSLVEALESLDYNKDGFMGQISEYITADVGNKQSLANEGDIKKRLSGLKRIDFRVLRPRVAEDNVREYVNMILLAMTQSISGYLKLMDYSGQFTGAEIKFLLTEFRKFDQTSRTNIKSSLKALVPDMKNRVKRLHDLL